MACGSRKICEGEKSLNRSRGGGWGRLLCTCAARRESLCCADELGCSWKSRARGWKLPCQKARKPAEIKGSGAFLSQLFGGVERTSLQIELPAVRILPELFGFLLS